MTNLNLSQQDKLFDAETATPITVIGAGSVGSYVVHGLAKMGVTNITVFDPDFVESHNIPMSLYRLRDLARPKVEALKEIIEDATGVVITGHNTAYNGQPLKGVIIACVDTMEARQMIWKAIENSVTIDVPILFDTRVSAELVWVFAISPEDTDDKELYQHHLNYSTKETAPPICGLHGIDYVSKRAAGIVCIGLTSWWQRGTKKRLHKELVGALEVIQ
jgi:hypothetical protein